MRFRNPLRAALLLWLAVTASVASAGQKTVQEGSTLHVYTNLLQIPVLILSQKHQPVPAIDARQFTLRLGDAPPFRPLSVRLEGDDPLTIAVLIDGSAGGPRLPQLAEAMADMAGKQLQPSDRLALYGMDGCRLRRGHPLVHADAASVRAAVQALQASPPFFHRWHGEKCPKPTGLWDSMTWMVRSLGEQPGRRVALVITNGEDQSSYFTPEAVRNMATLHGVAVFTLSERFHIAAPDPALMSLMSAAGTPNALTYVSELSGGMALESTRNDIAAALQRFPDLLRGRYIVEFQRPAGISSGAYRLVVSIGKTKDFIRSAGTSMPTNDPEAQDPAVQHATRQEAERAAAADLEAEPHPSAEPQHAVEPSPIPTAGEGGRPATGTALPPVFPQEKPPSSKAVKQPPTPPDPLDVTDEVQNSGR